MIIMPALVFVRYRWTTHCEKGYETTLPEGSLFTAENWKAAIPA